MRIRLILTIIFLLSTSTLTNAQSKEILAKSAMLNAEEAYNNENYSECFSYLKEAETTLGKTNSRIQYQKIKALMATSDWKQAEAELKVYFEVTPESEAVPEKFDEMVLAVSKIKRAIIEEDKKNALGEAKAKEELLRAGQEKEREEQMYLDAKNINRIDAFKKYIENFPKGKYAAEAERKIEAITIQMDYQAKVIEYTKIIESKPKNADAYFGRGNAKYGLNDFQSAILDFDKSIKIDPKHSAAYYNRGLSKFYLQDYPGAIQDYTKRIELAPQYSAAYNNRGLAKFYIKDYQGAIQDFTKGIELDPQNSLAFLNRGRAKQYFKDYQGAIQDFTKGIELDPQNSLAYFRRGNTRRSIKDYQGALQDYSKTIELTPDSPDAYYSRGLTKRILNDLKGAIQDYSKTIDLDPQNFNAYFSRAFIEQIMKDFEAAIRDYKKTIELNPNSLSSYYNRGKINQVYFNNIEAAKSDFEKVIELDTASVLIAFSHYFLGNKEKAFNIMNQKIIAASDKNLQQSLYYDLACLHSLANNKAEAIKALSNSFEKGYTDIGWIGEDEDFDNIRNSKEFKELIIKYKK